MWKLPQDHPRFLIDVPGVIPGRPGRANQTRICDAAGGGGHPRPSGAYALRTDSLCDCQGVIPERVGRACPAPSHGGGPWGDPRPSGGRTCPFGGFEYVTKGDPGGLGAYVVRCAVVMAHFGRSPRTRGVPCSDDVYSGAGEWNWTAGAWVWRPSPSLRGLPFHSFSTPETAWIRPCGGGGVPSGVHVAVLVGWSIPVSAGPATTARTKRYLKPVHPRMSGAGDSGLVLSDAEPVAFPGVEGVVGFPGGIGWGADWCWGPVGSRGCYPGVCS